MYNLLLKAGLTTTVTCKKNNLNSTGGGGTIRKVVKRSHGMRKFLLTALTEVGVDPQYRKILLGQDLGLDEHYLKPTDEQVLQQYTKAIDYITINNEHRLQNQVLELTEKQSDIEIMKLEQRQKDKQIAALEQRMKQQQEQQELQRKAQELQNNMLELIAKSMNINTAELLQQKQQQLDNTIPEDQYEDMELQHARRRLELDKMQHKIVREDPTMLMTEVSNLSKSIMKDDRKSAIDSAEKVLKNKDFRRYLKEEEEYSTRDPIDSYVSSYNDNNGDDNSSVK